MKKELFFMCVAAMLGTVCFTNLTADKASAKTSGDYKYVVTGKKKKTCAIRKYLGTESDVVIPEKIDGYTVTRIGNSAFKNNKNIKSVKLSRYITIVGKGSFAYCTKLESISLPDKVHTIKGSAFKCCRHLKSIKLPSKLKAIGKYNFDYCNALKEITIPSSVKTIGYSAFHGCKSLEKINFSEGLVSIGSYAFEGCNSLKDLKMPDSVEKIGISAFSNCTDIDSIYIPKNLKETKLQYVFELDSIKKISIAEGNIYYDSRDNCNAVIETSSNTLIIGLNDSTIPESITAIGKSAFSNCDKLKEISIPSSVKTIGEYAFAECNSLKKVNLSEGLISIEKAAFKECSSLSEMKLPDSVETIKKEAFSDCDLNSIHIPKNLKKTDLEDIFDFKSLTSITVGEGNKFYDSRDNCNAVIETASNKLLWASNNSTVPSGVITIGEYAFSDCDKIKEITIPASVKTIETGAFSNCSLLEKVILSEGLINIGDLAFSDCSSLKDIQFPDSLETIGQYTFTGCGITSVRIPKNLKDIYLKDTFDGENIKSISVDEGNKYLDSRNNCNAVIETESNTLVLAIENSVIPNTVKVIGEHSFQGTPSELVIPEGVEEIADFAFDSENKLEKITLPSTLKSIGEDPFDESLKTINYRGSKAQWEKIKIADDSILLNVKINYNYKG